MSSGRNQADYLKTPQEWSDSLSAPPSLSSETSGSPGALVRRWQGTAAAIEQPRLDHHYLTLHLGGPKRVSRRGEGATITREMEANAISLTPAGTAFSWFTEGPIDYAHVYLHPRALERVIQEEFDRDPRTVELVACLGEGSALLSALVQAILGGVGAPGVTSRVLLDSLLNALLVQLLCERSTLSAAHRPAPHALAPRRLRRVLDFIEDNLSAALELDDLACVAGSSRFHFSRAFRDATGFPPYRYVIRRRIEAAKALLLRDDLTLDEVAGQCGFNSHAQLSAMFKGVIGTSPARFRREH